METESKVYPLPTHSLPVLKLSEHIGDLVEIRDFVESRGIQTKNTRLERYIQYLKNVCSEEPNNESLVFKNSADGPFESGIDWLLYVLREVHELMWILRGLKTRIPAGLDGKLEMIVSGRDFAALDSNTHFRNLQFELRIASYFCQAGCEVDLTTDTDVVALTKEYAFYVECKRVASMKQLHRRLTDAAKQLNRKMPRKHGNRIAYGCIAADITKVAFTKDGLTIGLTNEHSRDVVQEKLISVANTTMKMPLFNDCHNLLQYWLQIHIPCLIMHPPNTVTRFSSYCMQNGRLNRNARKALKVFHAISAIGNKRDEREVRSRTLTRRTTLNIPAGTTFWFEEDVFREFLKSGRVTGKKEEDLIAELTLNGSKHEFSLFDLEMLVASIPQSQRKRLAKNVQHARLTLVLEMFIRRYPYENSEPDGQS